MNNILNKDKIILDLYKIGVNSGDTLFLRGDLGSVGKIKGNTFIQALLDAVGPKGTIVTLGFTKSYPFYKVNKGYIFDKYTKPETGALGKLFLMNHFCKRSTHPINSFLAIGNNADLIVKRHSEKSSSYYPVQHLINLKAKMLIFGIIDTSPGFTTVHFAQEQLGLTKKNILCGKYKVYFKNNGKNELFVKNDIGGCSKGFSKFYKHYLSEGIMKTGHLGNSNAILVDADHAYKIEYKLLKSNPSYHFCDDPLCFSCRICWTYNIRGLPIFLFKKLFSLIIRKKYN
jgi:aminoglycoside 3-N-acetyltransferase